MPLRSPRRCRAPDPERGSTLVEVLVVTALLAGVLAAVLDVLDTASAVVPRDVEWTHAIAEGRVGVAGLVRELRQADVVHGATPNRIDFELTADGVSRRIMYACDVPSATAGLRRCTRVSAASHAELPAPSTGTTVVDRVRNGTPEDPVLTYAPDPIAVRFVDVRVLVPSSGERPADPARPAHDVVLQDGAYLRNRDSGG